MKRGSAKAATWTSGVQYLVAKSPAWRWRAASVLADVWRKRLLSVVDQRLTQQEKERKAQELARLAEKAKSEREWDRALALCDEALGLSPANNTLAALRKSVVEGKQTQEKVSQLLAESANAKPKSGARD